MSDIQVLTRLPDWYANLARTATRVRLRFHPRTHYQGNEQAPRPGESRAFSVTGSPAIINRSEGKTDNHELGRKDNTPTQRKNDRGTQQVRQQRERRPSPAAAGAGTCPPTGSWRPSTLRPRHPMRASPAPGRWPQGAASTPWASPSPSDCRSKRREGDWTSQPTRCWNSSGTRPLSGTG